MSRYERCAACQGNAYVSCTMCGCKACRETGKQKCTACNSGSVQCEECKGTGWTGQTTPCQSCNGTSAEKLQKAQTSAGEFVAIFLTSLIFGWVVFNFWVGVIAAGLLTFYFKQSSISSTAEKIRKENPNTGKIKCKQCGGTTQRACDQCGGMGRLAACDNCNGTGRTGCVSCFGKGQLENPAFLNFKRSLETMPLDRLKHEYRKRNDKIQGMRQEIMRLEEMERDDREFYEREVSMGRRGGHAGDWPSTLEINPRRVADFESEISDLEEERALIDSEMGKKWT